MDDTAFDAAAYGLRRRTWIRERETLRICSAIEPIPDSLNNEPWDRLTRPLPLAGASAMRPAPGGGFPQLDALAMAGPWSASLITSIESQLIAHTAVGRPWIKIEPLLLVGAAGTGKTWFARRLGKALDLPTAALECANMTDDRLISGTPRGWSNAQPAWPLMVIANTRCPNPLIILDEIDKAGGSDRNGSPHRALLSLIEPMSAGSWHDPCLLADCDLSQINWIACANALDPIPAPLLSRFRIVRVPPPRAEDFDPLLASITGSIAAEWKVSGDMLPDVPARATTMLRRRFARQPSVRQLARDVRAILTARLADGEGPRRH